MKTTEYDEKGNNKIVIRTKGLPRDQTSWDIIKELYETGNSFTGKSLVLLEIYKKVGLKV